MTTRDAWSSAITSAVAAVPDEEFLRVAELILSSRLVLTAGNGGSAALASHAAQAISKPDYGPGGGRAAMCLTDLVSTLTAHANDGGWPTALVEVARPFLAVEGVCLFVISSSGKSENVVRVAELFREAGRPVIALTGFSGKPLRDLATLSLHVDSSDYEVIEPVHDAFLHRVQYHVRNLGRVPAGG